MESRPTARRGGGNHDPYERITELDDYGGALAWLAAAPWRRTARNIFVVGGKTDDPFFAKIKKGIDDAALVVAAHGGSVNYLQVQTYDNIGVRCRKSRPQCDCPKSQRNCSSELGADSEDEAIKAAQAAAFP